MRPIVLFCLLAFSTFPAHAQVNRFKCFQTSMINDGVSSDWENVSILVVLNFDRDKIHIYAKSESDFDIIQRLGSTHTNDYTDYEYMAVDQDGNRCTIFFRSFADKSDRHIATLSVLYRDITYFFRLQYD